MKPEMQVGWPGLSRAITLTIVLTSAFWIALGAWLFNAHVRADRRGDSASSGMAAPAKHGGLLSGFGGEDGQPARARVDTRYVPGRLAVPVSGVQSGQLVDTFSQGRAAGARRHDAIDILAPEGTQVVAAAPGTVEKLFFSELGGNTIYVRSADRRTIYYYAHLSSYAPDLREGMAVRKGQPLANVGHTGNASAEAPHLHFAVWVADPAQGWSQQGQAINPYPLLGGK